jgi:hypothetical protein
MSAEETPNSPQSLDLAQTDDQPLAEKKIRHVGIKPFLEGMKEQFLDQAFNPDPYESSYTLNPYGIFSEQETAQLQPQINQVLDEINMELYVFLHNKKPQTTEQLINLVTEFFYDQDRTQSYLKEAKQECFQRLIDSEASDQIIELREAQIRALSYAIDRLMGERTSLCFSLAIEEPNQIEHDPEKEAYDKTSLIQMLYERAERLRKRREQDLSQQTERTEETKKRNGLRRILNRILKGRNREPEATAPSQNQLPGLSQEDVKQLLEIKTQAYIRHYLFQTYESTFSKFFRNLERAHAAYKDKERETAVQQEVAEIAEFLRKHQNRDGSKVVELTPPFEYALLRKIILPKKDSSDEADHYRVEEGGDNFPFSLVEVKIDDEWVEILRLYKLNPSQGNDMLAQVWAVMQNLDNEKVKEVLIEQERDNLWEFMAKR